MMYVDMFVKIKRKQLIKVTYLVKTLPEFSYPNNGESGLFSQGKQDQHWSKPVASFNIWLI